MVLLVVEGELAFRRNIRFLRYLLRVEYPWRIKKALRRIKLTEFGLPRLAHFRIQTMEEYHNQYCDPLWGYCPKNQRYYEYLVKLLPFLSSKSAQDSPTENA